MTNLRNSLIKRKISKRNRNKSKKNLLIEEIARIVLHREEVAALWEPHREEIA